MCVTLIPDFLTLLRKNCVQNPEKMLLETVTQAHDDFMTLVKGFGGSEYKGPSLLKVRLDHLS